MTNLPGRWVTSFGGQALFAVKDVLKLAAIADWQNVFQRVVLSAAGYMIFDLTLLVGQQSPCFQIIPLLTAGRLGSRDYYNAGL